MSHYLMYFIIICTNEERGPDTEGSGGGETEQ